MEDFHIILYILAAVAYFLLTQWRKAFKSPDEEEQLPQPQQKPRRMEQGYPQKPVTSFEDILRELQPKAEKGRAVIEAAREEAKEPVPPLPPVVAPEKKYKSYEDLPPRVLSWEKRAEAIEALKRSDKKTRPVLMANELEEKKKPRSRYAEMLRNPASARDAVILSEIFNRKYS